LEVAHRARRPPPRRAPSCSAADQDRGEGRPGAPGVGGLAPYVRPRGRDAARHPGEPGLRADDIEFGGVRGEGARAAGPPSRWWHYRAWCRTHRRWHSEAAADTSTPSRGPKNVIRGYQPPAASGSVCQVRPRSRLASVRRPRWRCTWPHRSPHSGALWVTRLATTPTPRSAGLARFGSLRSVTHLIALDARRTCYGLAAGNAIDPGPVTSSNGRAGSDTAASRQQARRQDENERRVRVAQAPYQPLARNAAIAAVSSGATKALP